MFFGKGSNSKQEEGCSPGFRGLVVDTPNTPSELVRARKHLVKHNPFIVLDSSNLNVFQFPVSTALDELMVLKKTPRIKQKLL